MDRCIVLLNMFWKIIFGAKWLFYSNEVDLYVWTTGQHCVCATIWNKWNWNFMESKEVGGCGTPTPPIPLIWNIRQSEYRLVCGTDSIDIWKHSKHQKDIFQFFFPPKCLLPAKWARFFFNILFDIVFLCSWWYYQQQFFFLEHDHNSIKRLIYSVGVLVVFVSSRQKKKVNRMTL